MVSKRAITGVVLVAAVAAGPVFAEDAQRRRSESDRRGDRSGEQRSGDRSGERERAVPRSRDSVRQNDVQRQDEGRRQDEARQQSDARVQAERQRQYDARRDADRGRYDNDRGRYDTDRRRYDNDRWRNDNRGYRPYYSNHGGYGSRTIIVPRVIRPRIVTVVPYRPYVYRPSLGIGVYYGSGGSYPYGYTPRGYYDPLPGRFYGGVRITGAPRQAHVFADGYYVGIVNDFDGIFQHINLEAGPHHIEIEEPGFEPIAFDVVVQPGRTITFNADMYRY